MIDEPDVPIQKDREAESTLKKKVVKKVKKELIDRDELMTILVNFESAIFERWIEIFRSAQAKMTHNRAAGAATLVSILLEELTHGK